MFYETIRLKDHCNVITNCEERFDFKLPSELMANRSKNNFIVKLQVLTLSSCRTSYVIVKGLRPM